MPLGPIENERLMLEIRLNIYKNKSLLFKNAQTFWQNLNRNW